MRFLLILVLFFLASTAVFAGDNPPRTYGPPGTRTGPLGGHYETVYPDGPRGPSHLVWVEDAPAVSQPGPWMPTDTSLCPGGICPANVTGGTTAAHSGPAARGPVRGVARRGGRFMGRVLLAPVRLFGRVCRRGGCG